MRINDLFVVDCDIKCLINNGLYVFRFSNIF